MSYLSGKCDVLDHISGMGGWFDKDGNPVKFGEKGVGVFYSDILRDFEAFKKATDGVLYHHIKIDTIDKYNQFNFEELCPEFKVIEHKTENSKKITYTYEYWGKECKTLKEINKKGIYITDEIRFNTIFELIPFLPKIVSASSRDADGKETIYITDESYAEYEHKNMLKQGYNSRSIDHYRKELADLYFDTARRLIDIEKENTCEEIIENFTLVDGKFLDYEIKIKNKIDCNFPVKVSVGENDRFADVKDDYTILISGLIFPNELDEAIENKSVKVKYVKVSENGYPLKLN